MKRKPRKTLSFNWYELKEICTCLDQTWNIDLRVKMNRAYKELCDKQMKYHRNSK